MAHAGSPPQSSLSTPRIVASPWIVLVVVALGFFMILLDTTIVNVAIPSIISALHASLDQILWILNGYILVYAILLITAGRMGDMFGPKRLFMLGLALFTLASAACGLVQDPNQLVLFRVIQGVGGAILTPQTLSIITAIFPPEKRGGAFGVWGAVAGLAAVTGPTLGGFLTTTYSWRAIFYVNVPIGIIAIVLAFLLMPELTIHRKHHIDLVGMLLATAGLFALVFGLIEGERYNWGRISDVAAFNLGSIHAGLVSIPFILFLSAVLLVAFIWWEAREEEPLLPLSLFHDRNFTVGNVVSAVVAFAMLGLFLPMTIFLQSVLGLSAEEAGVVFVPMSLTSMFVAPISGRLADRLNAKYLLFGGLVLFSLGMGLVIWSASLTSTGLSFTPALVLAGIGMGFTFAPLVTLSMRHIAPTQAGAASGFLNTMRQVGGAFGSAVVGAVLQNRLGYELSRWATHFALQIPARFRGQFIAGFSQAGKNGFQLGRGQTGGGTTHLPGVPAAVAHQIQALGKLTFDHAFLNAMKPALGLSIVVMAAGAVLTLLMHTPAPAAGEQAQLEEHPSGIAAAGE